MKLTRPSHLKLLLAERGIIPSRAMGQNFLVDGNILRLILDAASLEASDGVIEIGPGAGVLTEAMAEQAGRVTAIEKDARLYAFLRERFSDVRSLTLVHDDAMDVDLAALVAAGYTKMVSNLPYSVGTRILMRLFEKEPRPDLMVVTLQLEVGRRLTAPPGSRDYGLVSVHAQRLYDVEIVRRISGTCFHPPPDVESAVIRLVRRPIPRAIPSSPAHFQALVKGAFTRRRKQIQRVLQEMEEAPRGMARATPEWFATLGIDPAARPETLSAEQWCSLSDALCAEGG
jgi:16S rRNA (adenine1518-N6/adenine1519-N6)-dimethyltransferase